LTESSIHSTTIWARAFSRSVLPAKPVKRKLCCMLLSDTNKILLRKSGDIFNYKFTWLIAARTKMGQVTGTDQQRRDVDQLEQDKSVMFYSIVDKATSKTMY
jgi:hypothetical protein